jgi:hypothetical protein
MKKEIKILKRKYVYQETYDTVCEWASINHIRPPNYKNNFPYFLQEYIKELRGKNE